MGSVTVVGYNSGGVIELIKDNEDGLLFNQGDYIDLSNKIKYLYENRNDIKRLGLNAYKDTKDYFLIDRCANEISNLYEKLIDNKEV